MLIRIIVIGDLHGKPIWKDIINKEFFTYIIFLGDYFDCYDEYTAAEQIYNFKEIIEFKKLNPEKVILLIGNHDHHYFRGMKGNTAGFQIKHAIFIQEVLEENMKYMQMAKSINNFLFSHAGITPDFLNDVYGRDGWNIENLENDINDLWKYKPKSFMFNNECSNPYGDDINQSPIWIRPRSLMRSAKDFKKRWIQIVGHTVQNKIDIKGKATGGRYYFIDTLGTSSEYLIIEDKKITSGKIKIED